MSRPVSEGFFTLWTGTTPLAVFRASSMREGREIAASDQLLKDLRRATVIGRPLLAFGAPVWVGLASQEERAIFDRTTSTPNPFGGDTWIVYLQEVDGAG
jgi:hypothetical protein